MKITRSANVTESRMREETKFSNRFFLEKFIFDNVPGRPLVPSQLGLRAWRTRRIKTVHPRKVPRGQKAIKRRETSTFRPVSQHLWPRYFLLLKSKFSSCLPRGRPRARFPKSVRATGKLQPRNRLKFPRKSMRRRCKTGDRIRNFSNFPRSPRNSRVSTRKYYSTLFGAVFSIAAILWREFKTTIVQHVATRSDHVSAFCLFFLLW